MSQDRLHRPFASVVPEIAACPCREARLAVDGRGSARGGSVARPRWMPLPVTAGPEPDRRGSFRRMLAKRVSPSAAGKPLVGVKPTRRTRADPSADRGPPLTYLVLLVSGGHCQFPRGFGSRCISPSSRQNHRTMLRRGVSTRSPAPSASASRAGLPIEARGSARRSARFPLPARLSTGRAVTCRFRG